jgi:hypothetical protein
MPQLQLIDTYVWAGAVGRDMHFDGTHMHICGDGAGLGGFDFDGSTITRDGVIDSGGNYYDIWYDGTYYHANRRLQLSGYSWNGTNYTLLGGIAIGVGVGHFGVYADGSFIHCAVTGGNLSAYTFDGANYVLKDSIAAFTPRDLWGDGTYIYAASATGGLRAYTFDGTNYTFKNNYAGNSWNGVHGDGTYVYAVKSGAGDDLYALTFDGTNLTLVDSVALAGDGNDVWYANGFIFANIGPAIYAFRFDGSSFSQVGTGVGVGAVARHCSSDGTFVWVTDADGNVHILGFLGGQVININIG